MLTIKTKHRPIVESIEDAIVENATYMVKDSIHMDKVEGAIKECLKAHPELMNGDYTDVKAARILGQSLLYCIFGNEDALLWKDTATRKEKSAMKACASDMFYICRNHDV